MILSCSHIGKSFADKPIIKDATFHIDDNECTAIVGINGAGKTTLLRILTGELSADSGGLAGRRGDEESRHNSRRLAGLSAEGAPGGDRFCRRCRGTRSRGGPSGAGGGPPHGRKRLRHAFI